MVKKTGQKPFEQEAQINILSSRDSALHQGHIMKDKLEHLESKLDELISLCSSLDMENKSLRGRESEWSNERRQLLIKNETARTKVESMITRLKSMESGE